MLCYFISLPDTLVSSGISECIFEEPENIWMNSNNFGDAFKKIYTSRSLGHKFNLQILYLMPK